jgi:membrane protein DedA with SNARE-associated domain
MPSELNILIGAAVGIAALHTLTGPDHYLPFVALSKSRKWNLVKTISWTMLCGLAHVLSSVAIGFIGIALGWSLSKISWLENIRGGIAAWLMLFFGLLYFLWGLWQVSQNKKHKHFDATDDGDLYVYEHVHGLAVQPSDRHKVTAWVLFFIFLMGPSEPMIPLLSYPAAQHAWYGMLLLIIVYTAATLCTMLIMVLISYYGLSFVKTDKLEKYMHPIAGLTVCICGVGMLFMGW